jgi:hypothetical protein
LISTRAAPIETGDDLIYLNFAPPRNDGKTVYRLTVKDVPVDGCWSISLDNANGY